MSDVQPTDSGRRGDPSHISRQHEPSVPDLGSPPLASDSLEQVFASLEKLSSPSSRWEQLLGAFDSSTLTADERVEIADRLLRISAEHFPQRDQRLGVSHHVLADEILVRNGPDRWDAIPHLRLAAQVYERNDSQEGTFNQSRLLIQVQLINFYRNEGEPEHSAPLIIEGFKRAIELLPLFIEEHQRAPAAVFQSLQICRDAADFSRICMETPLPAVTKVLKTMCKLVGLAVPKDIEKIPEDDCWSILPALLKAPILGALANYHRCFEDAREEEAITCYEREASLLSRAALSQSGEPAPVVLRIHGDEKSLLDETYRALAESCNSLGQLSSQLGHLEKAQSAFLDALKVPIVDPEHYREESIQGLQILAERFSESEMIAEASWLYEEIALQFERIERPVDSLEHLWHASKLLLKTEDLEHIAALLEKGLGILSALKDPLDRRLQELHVRFLWGREVMNQNLPAAQQFTREAHDQNLLDILSVCRSSQAEELSEFHLYALVNLAESLIEQECDEQAEELLLEGFQLLGGESDEPRPMPRNKLILGHEAIGVLMVAHSPRLAITGHIVLMRGIGLLDDDLNTEPTQYIPFLKGLVDASLIQGRLFEEALGNADCALRLCERPESEIYPRAVLQLIEAKGRLLENLGRYEEQLEVNRQIEEFRSTFGIEEDDDEYGG